MTVSTTPYFSWSGSGIDHTRPPYNACSPNLLAIQGYCQRRWGVRSLGCHVPPPSSTKSHPYGAANDLRFNGGRAPTLEAIDFLIANSAELGVNTIHDYFDNQRMWKPITGWTYNAPIGSRGGDWIHVETTPAAFGDGSPVEDRLPGTPDQIPGDDFMTPEDQQYLDKKFAEIAAATWAGFQFGAEYPPHPNRPPKDWLLETHDLAAGIVELKALMDQILAALNGAEFPVTGTVHIGTE